MATDKKPKKQPLRRRAEKLLSEKSPPVSQMKESDVKNLVHELQVHQVELEMQNEELRKAQEEIEESRSKYSDLYDFAPIGYFTFSPTGQILEVNLTGANLLGIERKKLIHSSFSTFVDAEFRSHFRNHCRNFLTSDKTERCDLKLINKDGGSFYASLQSILTRHGNTSSIRSVVSDITALREAETELKRLNAELEDRVRQRAAQLEILNLQLKEEITERKQIEEVLRRSEDEAKHLAHANAIIAEIGKIISSSLNINEVYKSFSEKVKELIPSDRITIGLIDLEGNTYTIPYVEGIVVAGRQPGDIVPQAGTTVEEVVKTGKGILVQMDNEEEVTKKFPGLLPDSRSGLRSGLTVPLISGDQVIGVLAIRSIKPEAYTDRDLKLAESIANQIAGAIANTQLLAQRQSLEERLHRSEKMEALGTLASKVAHDLNNILSGIVGYPDLILMELPEDSPLRESILAIKQSGKKAAAVVQDLLTLARRGTPSMEVLNWNNVISDYLKSPEQDKIQSLHPHVRFEVFLESDLLPIKGSRVHLSTMLMNLLSNAAEAIPESGVVTISTRNHYLNRPSTRYDNAKEGDYVVVEVSDTGCGISAGDMSRIFEPFFTRKIAGRSGTGLGLAVVWGTVKDHSGYIDIQSEEGKRTTFTLYFQVTKEVLTLDQSPVSPSGFMGKGETILVVDDVKEQRELVAAMLNKLNYRITSVSSGEEAIEAVKVRQPDLLILDMIMDPGIDGLETYRRIIKLHPGQKAIIVSGFSETERVGQALDLGAGTFVKKPYTLEKIGQVVRRELDKRSLSTRNHHG